MKIILLILSFISFGQSYSTLINSNFSDKFDYISLMTTNDILSIGYYNKKQDDGFFSVYKIKEDGFLELINSSCENDYFKEVFKLKIEGYLMFDNLYINGLTDLYLVFKPDFLNFNSNKFSCFYLFPEFLSSVIQYNSLGKL